MAFLLKHYTFSAKIRTLGDYYQRLQNQQNPPSGLEIVNTLRYFQQTLLGFLKDVQNVAPDSFRQQAISMARSSLFPSLNYSGLYFALNNLIDVYYLVSSGQIALGHSILNTIKCLYLFLERDLIDQMPYNLGCLFACFPKQLHQEILQLLCDTILPFTLLGEESDTYAVLSIPAVVMLVFQYTNEPSHHTWLLENLMSLRHDIYKDVLAVIAAGTSESRVPAANLLFHYWPLLNPHILDRKPVQYKAHAWTPSRCQHKECSVNANSSLNQATSSTSKASPSDYFSAGPSPSPVDSASIASCSIKKCYDPIVCAEVAETAPPIVLCKQCAERVVEEYSKVQLYFICQPMPTSNVNVCQNRGCQSGSRLAVSTCFSEDCIRAHQHVPIRLCQECHNAFHVDENEKAEAAGGVKETHIYHTRLPCPWTATDPKTCRDTVEAVVKLLKETSMMLEMCDQDGKRPKWLRKLEAGQAVGQEIDEMADEKRMLSRYGVWIMAGLCGPADQAPRECVGYIISMLFQWFATTALLPNDPMGSALEQLKTDFVLDWITTAVSMNYDVFVQCLMPKPPEFAKVGGLWDKLTTRTEQIKEGLNKLLALMPYDIISIETWDKVMPEWLEAICNEVPERDLQELKVNLCKIFEPDLCPLALSADRMYRFIGMRMEQGSYKEQQKAIDWISLLAEMEIVLPVELLLGFLSAAVKRLHELDMLGGLMEEPIEMERPPVVVSPIIVSRVDSIGDHEGLFDEELEAGVSALTPQDSPIRKPPLPGTMMLEAEIGESNAAFYATMLDAIMKQVELSEQVKHSGMQNETNQQVLRTMTQIVKAPWKGAHTCDQPDTDEFVDCCYCQETLVFHEILMEIVQWICPKHEVRIEIPQDDDYQWEEPEPDDAQPQAPDASTAAELTVRTETSHLDLSEASAGETMQAVTAIEIDAETGELMPLQHIQTAEIECEFGEELEFVGALPSEEVETAMACATTLTETDVGLATCQVTTATLVEGREPAPVEQVTPSKANFWYTSLGKFRFSLDELPAQLQLIYGMLIDAERHVDPDVVYCMLHSLKYLCLHAEALSTAHREHRGFLVWAQENLLIPKLWHMLRADYSQIAEICVPLILHCLTLPSGADMFWKTTNDDFMSDDWTMRFAAIEKVSLILMFIDPAPLRNNLLIQSALSNVFCFFIVAVEDPNAAVAQRALIMMEAIKPMGLKCLLTCLEAQFDSAVLDRPLILHRLYLLASLLPDQALLNWDFFLQRFDTLAIEAQLQVASKTGEIAFAQDLMHSDPMSELYQRKISRARQSLEQMDSVRSMVRQMDRAMPYQASVSLKRFVKKQETRLAQQRTEDGVGSPSGSGTHSRCATMSGREPCQCNAKGWHRCSLQNESAVNAMNKVRKVILMVKVMQAWKGFRRRMSAISIGTISTISVMSSLLNTSGSGVAPNTVSSPEVAQAVTHAARTFTVGGSSSCTESEEDCSQLAPNYLPKKSFAQFYTHPGDHTLEKLREFTDQESNFCLLLNRAIDTENSERHTIYLTLVLFMKFLSSKRTTLVNPDEKATAKKQSIVMRHLNTLLGYSNTERCFTIPPHRLRISAICNAFLAGLPHVLDNNRMLGAQILPIALALLQYMPSPQKFASDNQPINYSLWALNTHDRISWLWSILLVLYKYRFDQPPINDTVINLTKIIMNTLDAQVHVCATVDAGAHSPLFQSGDWNMGGYMPPPRGNASLRRCFQHVLLMVRVMRMWPRGHHRALVQKLSSNSIRSTLSGISSAGDSSSASDFELSDSELGPVTDTQLRAPQKDKKRLGVHRKRRKKKGQKRHEHAIEEGEETYLSPMDGRIAGMRFRSPRHSPPGSPVRSPLPPVERVETRIRQQIDEFDRSFVKIESPISPQFVTPLPTVVVTPGEPQLVRPEMLQVSAAPQLLVAATDGSQEVKPQSVKMEQRATVIEPSTSQNVPQVFTISPLASVSSSDSSRGQALQPPIQSGNVVSLDAQVLQSPDMVQLEAIDEERDDASGSNRKSRRGSDDRKSGLKSLLSLTPSQRRKQRLADIGRQASTHTSAPAAPSSQTTKQGDSVMVLRCSQCDQALENYDEDTIAMAVVCLSTFVHREPGMAAMHLARMLETVARVAQHVYFPWQEESNVFVPGNCRSVARQFLRVVCHQLAPNGLFLQLFQTQITDTTFFKTLTVALMDFQELNPVAALQWLLEGMTNNWPSRMHRLLFNLSNYIIHIPIDQYLTVWSTVAGHFDIFFRRYIPEVSPTALAADVESLIIIINHILRIQNFSSFKSSIGLLDSLTKLVGQIVQQAPVKLEDLLTICTACNRAFIRERDRQALSRASVNELLQAVKFKATLPEQNYLVLLHLILQDSGETVNVEIDEHLYNTCAAECARPFIQDLVDFIADLHVLNKVKNLARGMGFREDTLGGDLKAGLSQYVAVEISKGSVRDPRTVLRYLPWLLSPPSVTQQGPAEFVECVAHVRVLSWILLGALQSTGTASCLPIPIESSQHIADQIQFVLAGFAEQSKESVIHMSALFHAFHLCQLWTVYCEQASSSHPDSDLGYQALANVMDFWARVTPAVLQLLSHSKVLADMVNLHFLNTIEALQECQSAILCQLYPMWHPILSAYHLRVPSQLKVRLDSYENSIQIEDKQLEPWLKRVRFKISQVELQSSAATQFYSV